MTEVSPAITHPFRTFRRRRQAADHNLFQLGVDAAQLGLVEDRGHVKGRRDGGRLVVESFRLYRKGEQTVDTYFETDADLIVRLRKGGVTSGTMNQAVLVMLNVDGEDWSDVKVDGRPRHRRHRARHRAPDHRAGRACGGLGAGAR